MKQSFYFIIIALVGSFWSCAGSEETESEGESKKYVHVPPSLPEDVYGQLADGDCILRKGNGPLSYHLMNTTKEEYSHCGVVVDDGGEWKVIHTLGGSANEDEVDGVQLTPIDEFVQFAADSMLYICRPIFVDSAGPQIAERAWFYLQEEVPFDHGFSMFSTEEFYCSELLYYIFKDVYGKNIFDIQKKHKSYLLMFSTFFHEDKFEPVYHLKPNKEDWYVPHDYSVKE